MLYKFSKVESTFFSKNMSGVSGAEERLEIAGLRNKEVT